MKKFNFIKHTIRITIITLMVTYFGLLAMLNIPYVQRGISSIATQELKQVLDTEISIGNIDMGLLNRIIIQDLVLYDRSGKEILNVARFSAKFDISAILNGKIRINSIQLFGLDAFLEKADKDAQPNYQFIADLFAPKKENENKNLLDLRINSIIIRRSNISYDVLSEAETKGLFNKSHIGIKDLSVNISVKAVSADTINVSLKRIALKEKSGFNLKKLSLSAIGNTKGLKLEDFNLMTDNSIISSDSICLKFDSLPTIRKISDVNYNGRIKAKIQPSDIAVFIPKLKSMDEMINIDTQFYNEDERNIHKLKCLNIYTENKDISININGEYIQGNDSASNSFNAEIKSLRAWDGAINRIWEAISPGKIPSIISHLGNSEIKGRISGKGSDIENNLSIKTALGMLDTHFMMTTDKESGEKSYSGNVYSENMKLENIIKNNILGDASFNIDFNGLTYNNNNLPESYLKGTINYIDIKGYRYHNINLDGKYQTGGFDGNIAIDDENISLNVNGSFQTAKKTPVFKLTAYLDNFRPDKLKLTDKYTDTSYSLKLGADFTGNSIDDINGKISIDSLDIVSDNEENNYFLPTLSLSAKTDNGIKTIRLNSNFINGEVKGVYSYKTLPKSLFRVVERYIPSLFKSKVSHKKASTTDNDFNISLRLNNADFLSKVLKMPIEMDMPGELNGYIHDTTSEVFINANIPDLKINNSKYESTTLLLENPDKDLHCHLRTNMLMKKGAMLNLSVNALAHNDTISAKTIWGNNTNVTYSGEVSASTAFSKDSLSGKIHTEIALLPSKVILNDSVWNIHPSSVSIDKDSIKIRNFVFEHADQHVKINGLLGKGANDICSVNLRNVNLAYVMEMIQFHAVEFEGNTSGNISIASVFGKPQLDAKLDVKRFSLNGAILGRADIKGGFDNEKGRILLDADIRDKDNIFTKVKGYISPKEKGLDLDINAGGTNLAFLQHFIKDIFSDVKGSAYGHARLYGPFKFLDLEGKLKADIGMNVNILNNRFRASTDSVIIKSGEFLFKDVRLLDSEGNAGTANGYLRHTKLKKLNYMFKFDTNNMKILHAEENNDDFPFYGNIYASGTTVIRGNDNIGLSVDCNVVAENKTSFVYVLGGASEAIDKQFITFVDKTPKRKQTEIETELYHYLNSKKTDDEEGEPQDIRINMIIEPTTQAEMRIIMDPASGDYISARGTGNLRVNYFNKGDFQIFGNYNISEGIYKLSMQNVIRKDFILRPGGSVSFNGNPTAANLNVQAAYTVPSASLNDLLADASSTRGNIKVNCIVNLSGVLTSPNLSFDLELPTVNEEDRQLVKSLTSTTEQMNTQIIYLLGVGKFYTYDYAAQSNQSSATSSLAFSTLSGQLNDMLSQVIDSQNWNLGTNLTTGQNGWSDVEAEAILSGKLLNNRLIINGNFGYRENTLKNTNFVGDFEAIWLLTKNGDLRLRGYNQTNDRYFTKSTLTTQGIGFMYKKDFTKWNELFDWFVNLKQYRRNKLRQKTEKKNKEKEKIKNSTAE